MKRKLLALSTGFAVALGGCTLNPIGEDPGINRESNDSPTLAEGNSNDGAFAPEQDMPAPQTVDPATGTPTPPQADPAGGEPLDPGEQAPDPIIDDSDGSAPGDIASEEPILPADATIDGGLPFGDAGDAGDAAVPLGAR